MAEGVRFKSSESLEVIDSDNGTVPTRRNPDAPRQKRFLPSREGSPYQPTAPAVPCIVLVEPEEETVHAPDYQTTDTTHLGGKLNEESGQNASKMSLVGQLARTDSAGKPLAPVPSSTKGRYKPIDTNDASLRPVGRKATAQAPAAETPECDDEPDEPVKPTLLQRLEQQMAKPTSELGETTTEEALARFLRRDSKAEDGNQSEGASSSSSVPSGSSRPRSDSEGFRTSVAVVAKLMKWNTKTKASVTESLEKYPGHLRDVRDSGKQEKTQLPFPLMLLVKQEALPIIHNMAKAYKIAMGTEHKLTREAFAKYEELKNELYGNEVYI